MLDTGQEMSQIITPCAITQPHISGASAQASAIDTSKTAHILENHLSVCHPVSDISNHIPLISLNRLIIWASSPKSKCFPPLPSIHVEGFSHSASKLLSNTSDTKT